MENNTPQKPFNKWLALINIPAQMGIIIFLFYKLGVYLDEHYPSNQVYYFKILTMVGVTLSLYNVYRQVNTIGKNQ